MRNRCKVSSLSAALAWMSLLGCGDDRAGSGATRSTSSAATGASSLDPSSTGGTSGTSGSSATDAPTSSSDAETGDPTGGAASGSGTTAADACADSVLTWENFGEPFMLSWCTSCHHSALPTVQRACAPCYVNLDRHAGVHTLSASIELRVLDSAEQEGVKLMPPAVIIPDDQRALLREYLECGAPGPEVGVTPSNCPDPETVPDCP